MWTLEITWDRIIGQAASTVAEVELVALFLTRLVTCRATRKWSVVDWLLIGLLTGAKTDSHLDQMLLCTAVYVKTICIVFVNVN